AGPGINFHDLTRQFILLLQDQPREIGRVAQLCDHHALDVNAETFEDTLDQIVGEGPLLGSIAQEHADDCSHVRFDIDHEDFFIVPDEQGAPAIGGENSPYLHGHGVVLYTHSVG